MSTRLFLTSAEWRLAAFARDGRGELEGRNDEVRQTIGERRPYLCWAESRDTCMRRGEHHDVCLVRIPTRRGSPSSKGVPSCSRSLRVAQ